MLITKIPKKPGSKSGHPDERKQSFMSKPIIHFASRHSSGNTYWVLGAVCSYLKQQGRHEEAEALQDDVLNHSGSYLDALKKMSRYAQLVDDDEYYDLSTIMEDPV